MKTDKSKLKKLFDEAIAANTAATRTAMIASSCQGRYDVEQAHAAQYKFDEAEEAFLAALEQLP